MAVSAVGTSADVKADSSIPDWRTWIKQRQKQVQQDEANPVPMLTVTLRYASGLM